MSLAREELSNNSQDGCKGSAEGSALNRPDATRDVEGGVRSGVVTDAHESQQRIRFEHLDGLRACCSLWVVLEHHASKVPGADDFAGGHFAYFFARGNTAVSYFIVLSGFVMSYAYGERHFDATERSSFFLKRFSRVGLSYYAALLFAYIVATPSVPLLPQLCRSCSPTRSLLPTLLMAQAVFNNFGPLNATSWTVSTLVCLWLLYPWMQPLLRAASSRTLQRLVLLAVLGTWAVTAIAHYSLVEGPQEEKFWPGYGATGVGYTKLSNLLHLSPVFRLPEFVLGVASGLLLRRGAGRAFGFWAEVAAIALLAIPSIAASSRVIPGFWRIGVIDQCEPNSPLPYGMVGGRCSARSAFFTAIPAPLFCIFIYGSSMALSGSTFTAPKGGGVFTPVYDFLRSPVTTGLGRIGLQVYLFQEPMMHVWVWLTQTQPRLMGTLEGNRQHYGLLKLPSDSPNQGIYLITYLLALWMFAGAFVAYIEDPVMHRVEQWRAWALRGNTTARIVTHLFAALAVIYWVIAVIDCSLLWKWSVFDVEYQDPPDRLNRAQQDDTAPLTSLWRWSTAWWHGSE
jgi:peptidoglycan/LPS O-acetylase OafA/YrhL